MRGWWQDLTDLVLPAECGGCGTPRTVLCARCRAALGGGAPRRVRPVPEPRGLPVVHAVAPYQDAVRAMLLAHKERGALGLARPLGEALATAVRASLTQFPTPGAVVRTFRGEPYALPPSGMLRPGGPRATGTAHTGEGEPKPAGEPRPVLQARAPRAANSAEAPVLLVPVPSSRGAVRARGHDPARRIAFAAAGALRTAGVPARVVAALRQRRPVADQSGLTSRQRWANLAGALDVAAGADRLLADAGRVVLVDDLMTTGASLAEGARALRAAGTEIGVHAAAVLAASPDSFDINRKWL